MVWPFVLVIALKQMLKKMKKTLRNRNNTEIKGPINGCDQIERILQMTKTIIIDAFNLPFTTHLIYHLPHNEDFLKHCGVEPFEILVISFSPYPTIFLIYR